MRTYIRYSLSFPCNTDQTKNIDAACERLKIAVRRTITHLPILAGTVAPEQAAERNTLSSAAIEAIRAAGCAKQQGRLEVKITLKQINDFTAVIKKYVEGTDKDIYSRLNRDGMPPTWLTQDCFTPLPDSPDPQSSPVFAIQANFISGGLIVVLYLNHSVADLHGVSTIMRLMSSELPSRKLNDDDLRGETMAWALGRQILSDADGAPIDIADHPEYRPRFETALVRQPVPASSGGTVHVVSFNLAKIEACQIMINQRINLPKRGIFNRNMQVTEITKHDCLSALLWQAVTRARCDNVDLRGDSTLVMPVNIRNKLLPPLNEDYFGNAVIHAMATAALPNLVVPYSITSLAHAAKIIRESILKIDHKHTKSAIAIINEQDDVRSLNIPNMNFDKDLVITSWANLPTYKVDLGLGLGAAQWGRRISQSIWSYGCVVLPKKVDAGCWEVVLQLSGEVMDKVLADAPLMKFVDRVA